MPGHQRNNGGRRNKSQRTRDGSHLPKGVERDWTDLQLDEKCSFECQGTEDSLLHYFSFFNIRVSDPLGSPDRISSQRCRPHHSFFLSRLLQVETAELRDVRTDGRMRSSQRKIHRRRSEIPSGQPTAGWLPLEKKLSWRRLVVHLSYHRAGAQQGIGAAIDGEGPLVGPARNTKSNWGPTYKKK